MKQLIKPREKYDPYYKTDALAMIVGVSLYLYYAYQYFTHAMATEIIWIINIGSRILGARWVSLLVSKQNRDKWLVVLAFWAPAIMLIIMGVMKKRNIEYFIETDDDAETQHGDLVEFAQSFIDNKKYSDALVVYEYIVENYGSREEDVETYVQLQEAVQAS